MKQVLVRIVKMTFEPAKIQEFLANFNSNKNSIRAFDGCEHLELLQDRQRGNVYFTYSYWTSEGHLEQYRTSDLFRKVWSKTKPLFKDKPEAWSLEQKIVVDN